MTAFIHHDDHIRAAHSGQAMGNDKSGPAFHQSIQAAWMSFSVCVSTLESESSNIKIRGFISNARAIATRWRCPPERVTPRSPTTVSYPFGSLFDEFMRLRRFAAAAHFIHCRIRSAVCDIVFYRVGKQKRSLQDNADLFSQCHQFHFADIVPVDKQRAFADIVKTRD